ncbi:prepilin-type N-terminal cleavage/methylation domain-containing protein [Aquincola sp. S2]|uniref:Prepilin-type N-terminal cleavage/methylation domain-containing protein n=1 Tax=Pseudaquabacterium terrae TaxID=2732868 RepID=A0ABX2EKN8_9BURK|nr:prepilin-type N-terminal cleavage/methylation domain-containing protein [Aquabacterium terrae]NRF69145.1 prepilin-type N-terminal cleavage/methylation domain-containing protein [Aquabacterium terrae]
MRTGRSLGWVSTSSRTVGFTLIELLVVLAIVAVLLTLALPRYYGQLDAAKEAVLLDNLRTTRDVIGKFYGDTGRFPESLEELVAKRYLAGVPVDPITESATSWTIDPVPPGYKGAVYDVHSTAPGTGRNGVPYAQW